MNVYFRIALIWLACLVVYIVIGSDPGWLALSGTLFGGFFLKGAEKHMTERALAAHGTFNRELNEWKKVTDDPEFGIFSGYVCPTWEHNRIARELGDDDIMACGHVECPACYPHGTCAVAECEDPGTLEWASGFRQPVFEWLCGGHYNVRAGERELRQARMKEIKAAEAQEKIFTRVIDGRKVQLPREVPAYAHGEVRGNGTSCECVFWTWTDPETGKQMGTKQVLPLNLDTTAFYGEWTETIEALEKKIAKSDFAVKELGGKPEWVHSEYQPPRRKPSVKYEELDQKIEKLKRWATTKEWDEL